MNLTKLNLARTISGSLAFAIGRSSQLAILRAALDWLEKEQKKVAAQFGIDLEDEEDDDAGSEEEEAESLNQRAGALEAEAKRKRDHEEDEDDE
jgi:hypothetical protein